MIFEVTDMKWLIWRLERDTDTHTYPFLALIAIVALNQVLFWGIRDLKAILCCPNLKTSRVLNPLQSLAVCWKKASESLHKKVALPTRRFRLCHDETLRRFGPQHKSLDTSGATNFDRQPHGHCILCRVSELTATETSLLPADYISVQRNLLVLSFA